MKEQKKYGDKKTCIDPSRYTAQARQLIEYVFMCNTNFIIFFCGGGIVSKWDRKETESCMFCSYKVVIERGHSVDLVTKCTCSHRWLGLY